MADPSRRAVFRRATDDVWRLIGVGVIVFFVTALLWKLRVVVLPVFVALLLCSILAPLVTRLEARGWPTLGASWLVFIGFLLLIVGSGAAILPPTIDQFDGLSASVDTGLADVQDWLVNGPLDLKRSDVEHYTDDPVGRLTDALQSSSGGLVSGARLVGEALAGALLSLVLTFLFLKDGRRFQTWALAHVPEHRRDLVRDASRRAWAALSGYMRGAALLGLVEAIIIASTVWIVGGTLVGPVAILTFFAAFFPVVGAVVAGALAVLVTLATGGLTAALIVLGVAVAVQQLDNDLLAPFIYGQTLELHPAAVLIAITAGGALGGIIGAFVAVPLVGAAAGVFAAVWERHGAAWLDDAAEPSA